jgi:hypothetical protein
MKRKPHTHRRVIRGWFIPVFDLMDRDLGTKLLVWKTKNGPARRCKITVEWNDL